MRSRSAHRAAEEGGELLHRYGRGRRGPRRRERAAVGGDLGERGASERERPLCRGIGERWSLACYLTDTDPHTAHPAGVLVLTVGPTAIHHVAWFLAADLRAHFALPATVPVG
ncbi:hypothetical protein [Nocardia farcinica]|nr:hypothetical protein [Nocardia farcinica]